MWRNGLVISDPISPAGKIINLINIRHEPSNSVLVRLFLFKDGMTLLDVSVHSLEVLLGGICLASYHHFGNLVCGLRLKDELASLPVDGGATSNGLGLFDGLLRGEPHVIFDSPLYLPIRIVHTEADQGAGKRLHLEFLPAEGPELVKDLTWRHALNKTGVADVIPCAHH